VGGREAVRGRKARVKGRTKRSGKETVNRRIWWVEGERSMGEKRDSGQGDGGEEDGDTTSM